MTVTDTIVTMAVLLAIGIIVYTKVKKQDLRDTFQEIKDIFTPPAVEEIIPAVDPI